MTSRQLIAAEANNTDRIALYREGLFWKAYERSAYALCTQVRPFKPTRKVLKALSGGDIVSVGFPTIAADRILAGLVRLDHSPAAGSAAAPVAGVGVAAGSAAEGLADRAIDSVDESSLSCISDDSSRTGCAGDTAESSATRMVLAAPRAIDERDFLAWKSALPITLSIPRPAAADTSSCDETSAAELLLHGRSADAMRPAVGSADFATAANGETFAARPVADYSAAAVAGADFAAPAPQPRLWSRLGGWLVRWATGSETKSAATAADTASSGDTAASADCILDALRNFEVADKTPMECMMFIADLKKQLLKI
ncbi:MAG: hypothetical protein K2K43_06685 [Alistipes sp.]|nr:hypothetical protein [Alistipes sp.]